MMKTLTNIRIRRALAAYNAALDNYRKWSDMYVDMIKTKIKIINDVGVEAARAYESENLWMKEKLDKADQKLEKKKNRFYKVRGF